MGMAPQQQPVSQIGATGAGFVPNQVFYDDDFNMYIELSPTVALNGPGGSIGSVIIREHSYHLNTPEMLDGDPVIYNSLTGEGMDPADGYSDSGAPLNSIENYSWGNSNYPGKPIFYKVEPFVVNDDQGNPVYVPRWISLVVYPKGASQNSVFAQELFAIQYLDPELSAQSINPNVAYQYNDITGDFEQLAIQPDDTDGTVTYPNGAPAGNSFTNFTYQSPPPAINQSIQSQTPTGLIRHVVGSGSEIALVFEGSYYFYNPEDIVKHYDVEFQEL